MPDALWPNLPAYAKDFTPAQHAAHTSPKGIPRPEDLIADMTSVKATKGLMKVVSKPHLKTTRRNTKVTRSRRRKKHQ